MQDIGRARRHSVSRDRGHLHNDDVVRALAIDEWIDCRISQVTAVPIVLTIDFDRLEIGWEAGRSEYGLDGDRRRLENLELARADICCV